MARRGRHIEGARTRERVLEVAAQLIAHHGYAATSIARISKQSGANPASIYWAFGNKEGLFAAVMERAAASFFENLAQPNDDPSPWKRLARLAAAFEGGPEFLRLLLVLSLERREGDPAVLEAARRVRLTAVEQLAAGFSMALTLDDELERRRIANALARFTLMLLDGVFVASQIESEDTDLASTFEMIAIGVQATGERLVEEALANRSADPSTT